MSSERAGTPIHGYLDRDKAYEALHADVYGVREFLDGSDGEQVLDTLEACVVPDPRLARIEALCDDSDETGGGLRGWIAAERVRRILRGDE